MGAGRRTAAWIVCGVLAGGVVTGVVVSQLQVAGASPSHATPPPASQVANSISPNATKGGELWHGPLGRLRVDGPVLHGQFTVKTPSGGTQLVDLQNGVVTATSTSGAQTITVRSSDGFTQTYRVTASTRIGKDRKQATFNDIATGDSVRVAATNSNGTLDAVMIRDGKVVPGPGGHPWQKRQPSEQPTPQPSSASGTRT